VAKNVRIETDRLVLRTVTIDDVEDVALTWKLDEGAMPLEEANETIRWMLENHERNTPEKLVHLCLAAINKEDGEFIGWCGLDHREPSQPNAVLFYLLKKEHWGKGLATEAAKAVLEYAFCELGLAQIDGGAAAENVSSRRVMEKAGMRYVGRSEDGGHSFTLTKREFIQKFGCRKTE
jgi:ribosomal-protein-alanine N-acetyltransferase